MEISDTVFNVQKDPKVKIISDGKEQINIIKKKKKLQKKNQTAAPITTRKKMTLKKNWSKP